MLHQTWLHQRALQQDFVRKQLKTVSFISLEGFHTNIHFPAIKVVVDRKLDQVSETGFFEQIFKQVKYLTQ
jgi:hypothetical protein